MAAGNSREALTILSSSEIPVDLLLTDVILPKTNGKELFAQACALCPGLKVALHVRLHGKRDRPTRRSGQWGPVHPETLFHAGPVQQGTGGPGRRLLKVPSPEPGDPPAGLFVPEGFARLYAERCGRLQARRLLCGERHGERDLQAAAKQMTMWRKPGPREFRPSGFGRAWLAARHSSTRKGRACGGSAFFYTDRARSGADPETSRSVRT